MGLYSQMNTGGSGSFLDLPDDKMVRVRILDYPYVNSQSFEQEDGSVNISTKFTWEVWDYDSASVKLLSKGSSIFNLCFRIFIIIITIIRFGRVR